MSPNFLPILNYFQNYILSTILIFIDELPANFFYCISIIPDSLQRTWCLGILVKLIHYEKMMTLNCLSFIISDLEYKFVELQILIPVDMITGHPCKQGRILATFSVFLRNYW